MKTLFIETRRKFKNIDFSILDTLEGNTISLAATIQYIGLVPKVKQYLESKSKQVLIKKGAYHEAHVLGCNSSALDKSADILLLITDGKFHAMNNAIQLQREIYVFNTKALEKITQKEINDHNRKTEIKKKKFLIAKNVGLLVSTKNGQNFKPITNIKEKIERLDKSVYVFEANNINTNEFENFPKIQIWINTACYGMARDDTRILNLSNITEFLK